MVNEAEKRETLESASSPKPMMGRISSFADSVDSPPSAKATLTVPGQPVRAGPHGVATELSPKRSLSFKLNEEVTQPVIRLKRNAYTYDEVEKAYERLEEEDELPWQCPSCEEIIPVIGYARKYSFHNYFFYDLVSGLSVACLHLPQGLAYGLLANLTPISGVYTSIFSVLVYVLFGTVPHMSMGTNAVLSVIVAPMVEREATKYLDNKYPTITETNTTVLRTQNDDSEERMNIKLGVATTSTFFCGVILLLMGLFRMGFLTNYMPSSFVGGFTSAAALHIAMSQMKHVFHIKVPLHSGVGKLVLTLQDVVRNLRDANAIDAAVCVISAALLLLFDRSLNRRVKARIGYSLPSNLVLVILATVVSYSVGVHSRWGVAVVGSVGNGLPHPGLPLLGRAVIMGVLYDSLTQAVIVFTMSISMAMLMAKLHTYELDSNRELIAYGACNLLSSFFPVQSSSVSPPRTMILSNSGARTTFNGIFTAAVLLGGVTFLGELFHELPLATLAAMIIVAVLDVLMQVQNVPRIWRVSRTDCLVWVATWLSTALGDLEYGICVGVLMAALGFMVNNQYIKGELVVRSAREDLLVPGLGRAWTRHLHKTRIFYFPSQLFFANAESFKRQLYEQVFDPSQVQSLSYVVSPENTEDSIISMEESVVDTIILDCSAMTYIDIDGLNMLKSVVLRYNNVGVQVVLARCPHTTMRTLERGDFFELLPRSLVFHEVIDALVRETSVRLGSRNSTITYLSPSVRRVSTANLVACRSNTIL